VQSRVTGRIRADVLLYCRFHGKVLWKSAEEQAWLDLIPVGREFRSPDYERLQSLDLYACGQMTTDNAMQKLGIDSLEALHQQMLAAGLKTP
jgi:hypothetical protein